MAGFRKAKSEQAALKLGMYGAQGSGKTFTSLLIGEGLARLTGKRIAFVDTDNRGSDFYAETVPERAVHPDAFDFDAIYTRSITETANEIGAIDTAVYSVVVLDSITHIWEAAKNAYAGKMTSIDTIPFSAWAKIKKPYKDLLNLMMNSPLHVIICGRQGIDIADDPETGETKRVGFKMKAEGETPYEPHILIRMESRKVAKQAVADIVAFAEKDRTGVLAGREFYNPTFDSLIKPILHLLKGTQGKIASDGEAAAQDADVLSEQDKARILASEAKVREFKARFDLAKTRADLDLIAKELTLAIKKTMVTSDVAELREAYRATEERVGK